MKNLFFLILACLIIFTFNLPAEKLSTFTELTDPSMIAIDGNELYVLDDVQVFVYSLKDYRLLRKFGKKGEGPGELRTDSDLPPMMDVRGDYVLLNCMNKMIFYSKAGAVTKEKRLPFLAFQVIPFGKQYAVTKFNRTSGGQGLLGVVLFDLEFKESKTIFEIALPNDLKKGRIMYPFVSVYIQKAGDRLYVVAQQKPFEILRFAPGGEKLKSIKLDHPKVKVTKTYEKESWEWLKLQPGFKDAPKNIKDMIYFPKYLPDIHHFLLKRQNIYVQTFRLKGNLGEFLIMDLNGKLLHAMFLPGAKIKSEVRPSPAARYAFVKDKYYYLAENDDEEWELHALKWKEYSGKK
jgi:hypothetical protein